MKMKPSSSFENVANAHWIAQQLRHCWSKPTYWQWIYYIHDIGGDDDYDDDDDDDYDDNNDVDDGGNNDSEECYLHNNGE